MNNKIFEPKIVNIFLPIILTYVLGHQKSPLIGTVLEYPYVLGAQKNCLIETVLLSTHNICFG